MGHFAYNDKCRREAVFIGYFSMDALVDSEELLDWVFKGIFRFISGLMSMDSICGALMITIEKNFWVPQV